MVKPVPIPEPTPVTQEVIQSQKFVTLVTVVNQQQLSIPDIKTSQISKVTKTENTVTTTYSIEVETVEGHETYVVS